MSRVRTFRFTLNNYTEEELTGCQALYDNLLEGNRIFRCIIFQEEIGEENLIPHLQGFIQTVKAMQYSTLIRRYTCLRRASFGVVKGRAHISNTMHYCQKDETRKPNTLPYVYGEVMVQGRVPVDNRSNQFKEVAEQIRGGMNWKDVNMLFPKLVIRYPGGLRRMFDLFSTHREGRPRIKIYYGETRTGKSYTAMYNYPEAYVAPWPTGGRWWWPGYGGEKTVILNEFRHQVKMDTLLQLFDYHPFWIEEKGGNMKLKASKFIITTNIAPWNWYPKQTVQQASMLHERLREFATIYEFEDPCPRDPETGLPDPQFSEVDLQDRQEPLGVAELFGGVRDNRQNVYDFRAGRN